MAQIDELIKNLSKNKTTISVKEMDELLQGVYDFYEERNNPKMNALWLSNLVLRRLRNDKDFYVNIEGETGMGKSNLTLLLALLMCRYAGKWKHKVTGKIVKTFPRTTPLHQDWEQISVEFDFDMNMSFLDKTEELKNKYNSLDRYQPFIIDEGSKNLHKYGWQNKLQQMLVQMSQTERYQNKAFFVCFPNFKELTATFRNDRIKMRLYIYARHTNQNYASCIISMKDVNRWISDPWHMEENAKSFQYLLRRIPAASRSSTHILFAEKKLKGYSGAFDFPSLKVISPRIWKLYMKYKVDNATKEQEDTIEDKKESNAVMRWKYATKQLIYYVQDKFPEFKMKDFVQLTNVSQTTLSKLKREDLAVEEEAAKREKAGEKLQSRY